MNYIVTDVLFLALACLGAYVLALCITAFLSGDSIEKELHGGRKIRIVLPAVTAVLYGSYLVYEWIERMS